MLALSTRGPLQVDGRCETEISREILSLATEEIVDYSVQIHKNCKNAEELRQYRLNQDQH
jgi:hypothetical protein